MLNVGCNLPPLEAFGPGRSIILEAHNGSIVLINPDYASAKKFENLVFVNSLGLIEWKAQLPSSPDVFVAVKITPEGVLANTWSGFNLLLDIMSGQELARNYTK